MNNHITLVADKVAEQFQTGTNEIVAVGHDNKRVVVYSSNKKITKKMMPKKIDGVKIKVKKMDGVIPATDLVA